MVLAIGRANPLKNFPLTVEAWRALHPRPELCLFGVEPEVRPRGDARYVVSPSDADVNVLLNQATVFVQTSVHEGFCLPPLEAMAAGAPVVCTDAHGNRDFCRHEENCLLVDPDPAAVAGGIERVLHRSRAACAAGGRGLGDGARLRLGPADRPARGVPQRGWPTSGREDSGALPGRRVAEGG